MLSVAEALSMILSETTTLPAATRPLVRELGYVLGCVLAEDVTSDVDSPPHDKSMVDGYAVVAADLVGGAATLRVLEEVTAGEVPRHRVETGTATRLMTGAPLPDGADAVVMIEQTQLFAGEAAEVNSPISGSESAKRPVADDGISRVQITDAPTKLGQNIMRRATSLRRGQTVLAAGRTMRPGEIGVAAEVGRAQISVIRPATVGVLATGNELVDASQLPGPGQIRNSNGPLLVAATRRAGGWPMDLGIARDERAMLEERISSGLQLADILVLSGGVSAGVLDLVPSVLANMGVEQVFHKVNLKPGKPLWFGVLRQSNGQRNKLVFGLPGNPVSSLVCFELFVKPAMRRLAGHVNSSANQLTATLTADFRQRGDRETYFPATLDRTVSPRRITPLPWRGSADLCGFSVANALAIFPAGDRVFQANETINVLPLDE